MPENQAAREYGPNRSDDLTMTMDIEKVRNIGIIAHIDAGKTTTTERILYYAGAIHRMGNVDEGTTTTDVDLEEAKRGITIYSAAVTCKWRDITINLIDTPGHVDFTAEVERSLRVLDGGVVVFSAVEGVEAQSETVWRQADRYKVPRLCFINKMDRIGASFERTFDEIIRRLGGNPVAVTIPIGAESAPNPRALSGVIDLVTMKALRFDPELVSSEVKVEEIPEEEREEAERWRSRLIDTVSLLDDRIMESFLEGEDIDPERIHSALRAATLRGEIQPTFAGASLPCIGVQPILDGVALYLPSPLDRPPVEGLHPNPKKPGPQIRKPTTEDPLTALVFKIVADQHADLYFVRVYSGVLKGGSRVLNARTGKKELISQLWHIQSDRREKLEVDQVEAGDIVGVIGPRDAVTGDTLCDAAHPILLEKITFPETVISVAAEPDSSAERKKLAEVLERLARQDPTFTARISEETGQTIISGMGELHLEVIRNRMERDFGLKVRVHKPRVSYRETIQKAVEAVGEVNRNIGGTQQFARIRLRVEPHDEKDSIQVVNRLKPGTLSADLTTALERAVTEEGNAGGVVGYPLMRIRFTIVDVDTRIGETTEAAVQSAAKEAVRNALTSAGIALLEPIMRLQVTTPDEYQGNIQADLQSRRAIIVNSERRGDLTTLTAEAALSQMFGYSTDVRGLSKGRASYSMEPLKYDFAPKDVLEKMMG